MKKLQERTAELRLAIAPGNPLRDGSLAFNPPGIKATEERLAHRDLPSKVRGVLRALEEFFVSGEPIRAPHDARLARSLERFLERLHRKADPESLLDRYDRVMSLDVLEANFHEVRRTVADFLSDHPVTVDTPHSHLLLVTALVAAFPALEDEKLLAVYRATAKSLETIGNRVSWLERAEVLRMAISERASRRDPPCEALRRQIREIADKLLDERYANSELHSDARSLLLDLALFTWRNRRSGVCEEVGTWTQAREMAWQLLARGGLETGADVAAIRRTLERMQSYRPKEVDSAERKVWNELVLVLEDLYWGSMGPRGRLLRATYRLEEMLGKPRGKREELEVLPVLLRADPDRRKAPSFPAVLGEFLTAHRDALATRSLEDLDRYKLVKSWHFLLGAFDADLDASILSTSGDLVDNQARFKANSDSLRDQMRNTLLELPYGDGYDHALALWTFRTYPPGSLEELVQAVENALAVPADAGSLQAWSELGRALTALLIDPSLSPELDCEVPVRWLEARMTQARGLAEAHPHGAAHGAAVVVAAHWNLGILGRACDRAQAFERAARITREATAWSVYLPGQADPFDWYLLRNEVRDWASDGELSPEVQAALASLREALDARWRASSGE
jgi:hypothetical protein